MSKILSHVHTLEFAEAAAVVSAANVEFVYWPDPVSHESILTDKVSPDREAISIVFDVVKVLGPINNTMITMPWTNTENVNHVVHNILVHRNGHVTCLSGGEVVGDPEVVYTLDNLPVTITEEVVRYG